MPVELKRARFPNSPRTRRGEKKWTREEVPFFGTTELFAGTPYESIEGELIDKKLAKNLRTKAELYARAAIPDYWVFDVNGRSLIVHREPAKGKYNSVIRYSDIEKVAPLSAPKSPFEVRDVFPPSR
jgi:hypothetical protein